MHARQLIKGAPQQRVALHAVEPLIDIHQQPAHAAAQHPLGGAHREPVSAGWGVRDAT